ncbi:hypothetical protein [Actinomadura rubrisoli]|uniref:Uncharacterized protein n=1 Tax=Actinomadura rubrisoli TaxID=2530368 RepID=A0A4R5BVU6_9ACTN|nr:hypothetical protein [Actinomadura rubrisoli]TDD88374.1 hypothetical protein E1298_15305 [Actinomadura rubrisoli]
MTETLCHCGKPVGDAVLCVPCAMRLDEAVAQISGHHGLGWDLDIAITRQARIDRPIGRPDIEDRDEVRQWPGTLRPTPVLYDESASKAAADLLAILAAWAGVVAVETGLTTWQPTILGPWCRRCQHPSCSIGRPPVLPPATIAGLAAWLRPRVGWLRHHHDAQRALEEIGDAVRDARRAIDRPAEKLYAGPCDECGEDMYGRVGARIVECPPCELVYEVEARRQWLLRSAEDVLATATEIARAITRLGQPVTPEAIRGLVHRGQLAPHGARTVGKRELPVYRLGDVLDVLAQRAARDGTMAG